jgi:L-lactate utilization protein LutC
MWIIISRVISMGWDRLADGKTIEKASKALVSHGIEVSVANNREEAKAIALGLLPLGAEVFAMSSVTLDETGIRKEIDESGRYVSAKRRIASIEDKSKRDWMRRAASACQYVIGSVHAVTESGQVVIASQSGSQLAPYAFSAGSVIWVVGSQKIVKDMDSAMRRIREHVVPLEDARARMAYGIGTSWNKTLIIEKEAAEKRVRMIIVKEKLGF